MAAEEEEDRVESVSTNGANLLLCDLCEGEGGASLEIYVVREGESGERRERRTSKEVGCCSV